MPNMRRKTGSEYELTGLRFVRIFVLAAEMLISTEMKAPRLGSSMLNLRS